MKTILTENEITLTRNSSSGTWVKGIFTKGSDTVCTIECSVQPAGHAEMMNLPESQRKKNAVMVFARDRLLLPDLTNKRKADRFTFNNKTFEVQKEGNWSQLNIHHYEYIAVEVDYLETSRKP